MIKLNRKVEYALIALKHMSEKIPGELTTAKEVCAHNQSPFDATARVMQIMAQQGLLKSEQGAHGGYLMVKDLSKISLHDLNQWIMGPQTVVKCLESETACEMQGACNFLTPAQALNLKLVEFLKTISLKSVVSHGDLKRKIKRDEAAEIEVIK